MAAIRLYYFEALEDVLLVPWLEQDSDGAFVPELKGIPNPFRTFERVSTLAEADATIVPNNIRHSTPEIQAKIVAYADQATQAGKPLFLFSCADLTDRLQFDPRAYVFRYSTYRSTIMSQDIVMPTLTDDHGKNGIQIRTKSVVPVVSFCGQAGYNKFRQWLKFYMKTAGYQILSVFVPSARARIIGVYWRRLAIKVCRGSSLITTHFVIRHSFSAAQRTIELDPIQAREEFIRSIRESDFVLAPKGDGNYSNRFLEALSLGRIPVLIDTQYTSPLEDEIDYDQFIVRVPMTKVHDLPKYIRAWYDPLSEEEWQKRQKQARELYETRLRIDSFFTHFFATVLPSLPVDASSRTVY